MKNFRKRSSARPSLHTCSINRANSQEFQDKFTQYFDTETIPEEDLPESARVQPEEEYEGEDGEDGEEKKTPVKAKGKATKGKAKKEQDEQADTPKKPTSKGKKTVKKNDEEDDAPSTPKKKPASKRKVSLFIPSVCEKRAHFLETWTG